MALEEKVRRRRGPELEAAILTGAWQQLLDGGYGGFTIDAVADRAGTSRSVLYRRWPDRSGLLEATLAHGLRESAVAAPDEGSLRADAIELLRRSNAARGQLAPLFSVLIGAYFAETGRSFADIRGLMLEGRTRSAWDDVLDRAVARGEAHPASLTPRVRTVAFDLLRNQLFMTFAPLEDEDIVGIVDEILLPLVRPR